MGELSKLRPRKKTKADCPLTGKAVDVTKWYRGKGDPEDIGNPDVYVLVCEQPWTEGEERVHGVRKIRGYKKIDIPCGYGRFCPKLYDLWLEEIKQDKKTAKKAEEKPEKEKEPQEPEKPEYLPEAPQEPEEPEEPEAPIEETYETEKPLEEPPEEPPKPQKVDYKSPANIVKKIDGLETEIGELLMKARFSGLAENYVFQATRSAHNGFYSMMMDFLNEAERSVGSDEEKDNLIRIRVKVKALYKLKHGPEQEKTING